MRGWGQFSRVPYPWYMVRVFIGLGVVALALLIYCMVELFQTPRQRVRVLSKVAWFFIILLLPLLGPGLWMAFGRAKSTKAQPERKGPVAPDDDPEFLRRVEIERRQQQRRNQEEQKRIDEARRKREAERRSSEQNKNNDAAAGGPEPRSASEDEDPESGPESGPKPQRG